MDLKDEHSDFTGTWIWTSDPAMITVGGVGFSVCQCRDLDVFVSDVAGRRVASVRRRCDVDDDEVERIVVETFSGDATLRQRLRFFLDALSDSTDGEPACEEFDVGGRLRSRSFYSNGVLQDCRNGEPGWTDYYPETGRERLVQRFLAGDLNDGPNGEPAYLELAPDGAVVEESHFRRGQAISWPGQEKVSDAVSERKSRPRASQTSSRSDPSAMKGPR